MPSGSSSLRWAMLTPQLFQAHTLWGRGLWMLVWKPTDLSSTSHSHPCDTWSKFLNLSEFLIPHLFFFNISVVPGVKPRPHKCYTSILPLSYRPSPVIPHFLNDSHTTHFSGWWGLSKHQNITSILYQGTILIPLMFQKALWLTANEMVALNDQEGWREG
jgi:hypothetical protein